MNYLYRYITLLPIVVCYKYTLVDVRHPGKDKYAVATFFMCLAWMGLICYYMVLWYILILILTLIRIEFIDFIQLI